jgi:hypothetical protein
MKTIQTREKYLTYSGDTDYALRLNNEIRQAFAIAGMDMPKMLNDFLFGIEVALQNEGVLDEDFNKVTG